MPGRLFNPDRVALRIGLIGNNTKNESAEVKISGSNIKNEERAVIKV